MAENLVGRTLNNYRIERLIGHGGLGSVYQARDLRSERNVVLKVIHPHLSAEEEFRKEFLQRAKEAASLDHSRIVKLLDYDLKDEYLYIAMPLLSGGSLTAHMQRIAAATGHIELDDAIEIACQIADALLYAHERGVVHYNIKPDNILFRVPPEGRQFQIAVMDFGLGRLAYNLSQSFVGMPTAMFVYIAPEQLMGEDTDRRVDIYALGVILYQLVTGKQPYDPQNLMDAVRLYENEQPKRPSELRIGLPVALDNVILKALAKNPQDRHQTAGALAQELRQAQSLQKQLPAAPLADVAVEGDATIRPAAAPPPPLARVEPIPTPASPLADVVPPQGFKTPNSAGTAVADVLEIVEGPGRVSTKVLSNDSYLIGRDDNCDIFLDHYSVSRRHAHFEHRDGYRITDLGSTNGTWLDNRRLEPHVETVWTTGATVRVGDVWLRILSENMEERTEPFADFEAMREFTPIEPIEHRTEPPPAYPYLGFSGRIDALAIPESILVEAGGTGNIILEIINQSTQADHVLVQAPELPPTWITLPNYSLLVPPGSSKSVPIVLHPPRSGESTGGAHPFTLIASSLNNPGASAQVRCQLEISPFHEFTADLRPKVVTNEGQVQLILTNQGNISADYRVTAQTKDAKLNITPEFQKVSLLPGQSVQLPISVGVINHSIWSGARRAPFEVSVEAEGYYGWQWQRGEVIITASMIPWVLAFAFGVLLLVGCIFSVIVISQVTVITTDAATANFLTEIAAVATASFEANQTALFNAAFADDDGDGLSNARETGLGSNANDPDSDDDNVLDGQEVDQNTSPTNPDTDGDGITDEIDEIIEITPEVLPSLDISQPENMVVEYYNQVNARNYAITFPQLTENFKINLGATTPELYAQWWDQVATVVIGGHSLVFEQANVACVYIELTYSMKDGRQLVDVFRYVYLVRDPNNPTRWLIDAKALG
jgi:serine/threonine-protein kinase